MDVPADNNKDPRYPCTRSFIYSNTREEIEGKKIKNKTKHIVKASNLIYENAIYELAK